MAILARICLSHVGIALLPVLGRASQSCRKLHRCGFWRHGLPQPFSRLVQHYGFSAKSFPRSLVDSSGLIHGFRLQLLGPTTCCQIRIFGRVEPPFDVEQTFSW
jgi:hypothetical protein